MACHVVVDQWMLREAPSVLVRVAVKLSLQIPIVFVALRGRPVRRVRAVVDFSAVAGLFGLQVQRVAKVQIVQVLTLQMQAVLAARQTLQSSCAVQQEKHVVVDQ